MGSNRFDRILGSLHAVPLRGRLVGLPAMFGVFGPDEVLRRYFAELTRLVEGSGLFQVLAHLDFPRRYWPASAGPYEEKEFEDEYRTVLHALAESGRVLELNTKSPLVLVELLGWWRDEGGRAVSFGSDSHQDWRVGDRFDLAVDIAEAAGLPAWTGPLRLLAPLSAAEARTDRVSGLRRWRRVSPGVIGWGCEGTHWDRPGRPWGRWPVRGGRRPARAAGRRLLVAAGNGVRGTG